MALGATAPSASDCGPSLTRRRSHAPTWPRAEGPRTGEQGHLEVEQVDGAVDGANGEPAQERLSGYHKAIFQGATRSAPGL